MKSDELAVVAVNAYLIMPKLCWLERASSVHSTSHEFVSFTVAHPVATITFACFAE